MFSEPAVAAAAHADRALHRSLRRRRAPLLARAGHALDQRRGSAAPAGPGRLLPLRVHAHEAAERRQYKHDVQKFVKLFPHVHAVPVVGRGQPRQHPRRALEPVGGRGGAVLPGAAARLQRLHRRSASTCSTARHRPDAQLHRRIQARDRPPARRRCRRSGACTTTRTSTAWKAGARAKSQRALGGQVWLTETGGIVQFGGAFPNNHGSGPHARGEGAQIHVRVAGSEHADQAPVHLRLDRRQQPHALRRGADEQPLHGRAPATWSCARRCTPRSATCKTSDALRRRGAALRR